MQTSPTPITLTAAGNAIIDQTIHASGDIDWYNFSTTTAKPNIRVTLTNLPTDYDVRVYKNTQTVPIDNPNTPLYPHVMPEVIKHNTTGSASYKIQVKGFRLADFTPNYMYRLKIETSGTPFGKTDNTGENIMPSSSSLAVYPNPAKDYVSIEFESSQEEGARLQIFNLLGEIVYWQNVNAIVGKNTVAVQLPHLPQAVYVLQLNLHDQSQTTKFVIY